MGKIRNIAYTLRVEWCFISQDPLVKSVLNVVHSPYSVDLLPWTGWMTRLCFCGMEHVHCRLPPSICLRGCLNNSSVPIYTSECIEHCKGKVPCPKMARARVRLRNARPRIPALSIKTQRHVSSIRLCISNITYCKH